MKAIEVRFAKELDKSFVVFRETGKYFPCPWHYHPEYEFVLVNKSSGRRMVGDHIGYFNEGDLVFMGPHLPHVWVNDEEFISGKASFQADAVVIHFLENFLGEPLLNIPELDSFRKFLELSKRGMVIKGKTRIKVSALMTTMTTMNGLQRLSALFSIFDMLSSSNDYELLASPGFVHQKANTVPGPADRINEFIMRNIDRDISLQEIASVANMATTTFCNFFKSHYRMTFIEYLNSVRIGLACKLLADKKYNIVSVAYEVGFNNLGNFNRQFKKIKNMTPRDYRKKLEIDFNNDKLENSHEYVLSN